MCAGHCAIFSTNYHDFVHLFDRWCAIVFLYSSAPLYVPSATRTQEYRENNPSQISWRPRASTQNMHSLQTRSTCTNADNLAPLSTGAII
ncbi:hypothetical protein BDR06DRAFT_501311 [Suillus hirtellus]|nr:hypothetical protein BDR06DRAFT_501311 [Suillus hirtellus]